jgi:methionine-gamma-lyase
MRKKEREIREKRYSMESNLIYGKYYSQKWDFEHHLIPPISSSATFRLDNVQRGAQGFIEFAHTNDEVDVEAKEPIYIYDRLGEPNKDLLEENLAFAERADTAVTFSSGMGAISAILGILTATGDEIVTHSILYGCTYSLLKNWYPRYKINVRFVNMLDTDQVRNSITPRTPVIYFETPINPTLELIDIDEIVAIAREANRNRSEQAKIRVVIDNTFATPFCQRPFERGADFVVHSLTKNIGGYGTDMGGAVIGPAWSRDWLLLYRKDFGAALGPKSAWNILVYGLPTLPLRMWRQQETAGTITEFLCNHEDVSYVNYPGAECFDQPEIAHRQMVDYDGNPAPGSMIYFGIKGDTPEERRLLGEQFINHLATNAYTITLAVSLGNIRTLVEHPGSMTHSSIPPAEQVKQGMDPGGVRLSVGLEKPEDIITDLKAAFEAIGVAAA